MTANQINRCGSPFHAAPECAIDGLNTRLRSLSWSLFDDTTFFTVSFDGVKRFNPSITCHVEHRTTPATTADASLNAAIETVGDMFREPSIMWPRVMPSREYGPGSWTSFFHDATYEILDSIKSLRRLGFQQHPYDSILCAGGEAEYKGNMYQCWRVDNLIKTPGHWSCIMWDTTAWYDLARDSTATYILRTELMACVALLSRQLEQRPRTGNLYQRSLKATVVTMVPEGGRVIQAWYDPLSPSLVIALTLRATYDRSDPETGFPTESVRNILRWILQPDDPWTPGSEKTGGTSSERKAPCTEETIGDRVVSSGSDPSQESSPAIAGAEASTESGVGVVNLLDGLSLQPAA